MISTGGLLGQTLLDETTEGGQTGTGTNHNDGVLGVHWKAEA